jgi:hypothetical protein
LNDGRDRNIDYPLACYSCWQKKGDEMHAVHWAHQVDKRIEKIYERIWLPREFSDILPLLANKGIVPLIDPPQDSGLNVTNKISDPLLEDVAINSENSVNVVEMTSHAASFNDVALLSVEAWVSSDEKEWTTKSSANKDKRLKLKCGLDTGATSSIMSHLSAVKNGIKILKSDKMFKTADGVVQSCLGKTKPLTINVQGRLAVLELIVIDHHDHDILLGLDWFGQTEASFQPSHKLLKFPKKLDKFMVAEKMDDNEVDNESIVLLCFAQEADEMDMDADIIWDIDANHKVQPGAKLSKQQKLAFDKLAETIEKHGAKSLKDLGRCRVFKHKIRTVNEDPIFIPPYRKSQTEKEEINKLCDELFQAGIIRRSKSPYSFPSLLVPKPDGSWRLVIDYRLLNRITIQQN